MAHRRGEKASLKAHEIFKARQPKGSLASLTAGMKWKP